MVPLLVFISAVLSVYWMYIATAKAIWVCTKHTEQTEARLPGAFCIKLVRFSK